MHFLRHILEGMSESEVSERSRRMKIAIEIAAGGSSRHALSTTGVTASSVVEYGAYGTRRVRVSL